LGKAGSPLGDLRCEVLACDGEPTAVLRMDRKLGKPHRGQHQARRLLGAQRVGCAHEIWHNAPLAKEVACGHRLPLAIGGERATLSVRTRIEMTMSNEDEAHDD
jgi:hypothetical protein